MANSLKRGEQHFVFAARDLFHRRFAHSLMTRATDRGSFVWLMLQAPRAGRVRRISS